MVNQETSARQLLFARSPSPVRRSQERARCARGGVNPPGFGDSGLFWLWRCLGENDNARDCGRRSSRRSEEDARRRPVTGGGDSYFIVHVAKNILGMNPLLVNYNSHYNTKLGIRNLANLSTVFDCDIVTSTLSPNHVKKITNQSIKQYGSMYWQALAGYTTFPVQTAIRFRIPLIIWGVHPWSEQTGMFSHIDEVEMSHRCRKEHALMGISAEDLVHSDSNVTRGDVQPFIYPYDNELEAVGVRGIYLSNYIRWDSKAQHELMIDQYGYESSKQQRTFNTYEDVHCFHSSGIHDYIKYLKYGYSKVTDHASREIRLKRMTRKTGIEMVKK